MKDKPYANYENDFLEPKPNQKYKIRIDQAKFPLNKSKMTKRTLN